VAIGLVVGLCIALIWPITHHSSDPPPPAAARIAPQVIPRPASASVAAALDAEWAAYSDRSSCADWAGGDGVSAIRLNSSQIAWFFSDTYLGPAGPTIGFSRSSGFLNNAVVVQTKASSGSRFVTLTGGGACGRPGDPTGEPAPVVAPGVESIPGEPGDRYWDEDGIVTGGTVVKFYNRYLPGGVPFVPAGTAVASFPVSALSAAGKGSAYGQTIRPSVSVLPSFTPSSGGSPVVWGAALLRVGNTVYIYGTQTSVSGARQLLYLARAPASRLTNFAAWQFHAGPASSGPASAWVSAQDEAQPVPSAALVSAGLNVASGFSVIKAGRRYWLIQATVTGEIDAYPASTPSGPFGQGVVLYRDSSIGLDAAHDYRIMYEARAEPALSTASTLVISYNVNSAAVTTGCVPLSVYTNTVTQPRFITVPMKVFSDGGLGGAPGRVSSGVKAGASDYPSITNRDPAQWFNGWTFASGCPPLPALSGLHAAPAPGSVVLTWPSAGLGVKYQVYLQRPGAAGLSLVSTARSGTMRLGGLAPGIYEAQVVPVNFRKESGAAAEVTFSVP
jgi:hypothetical protein